jgi:3-phosphoshikimate 1-carboxyvinyltransferase
VNLVVHPGHPLRGVVSLPGDKSLSHRAALLAAVARGESHIGNFLQAGVTSAMLDALTSLGVSWQLDGDALIVAGKGLEGLHSPDKPIDCGSSATTVRMLAGVLAAAGLPAILDGSEGLRSRPMQRIVEPLRLMGVEIHSSKGCAPLTLEKSTLPLQGMNYSLPVASAQLKSCLLLAGLSAESTVTLCEPGPSRDHTERMLSSMGAKITSAAHRSGDEKIYQTILQPRQAKTLTTLNATLPGDISSAAFLVVAALVTPGSQLLIKGVGLNPTRTGILDVLMEMGADIRLEAKGTQAGEPVGNINVSYSNLMGARISGELVVRMIDEFPVFGVAAAYARNHSTVSQAKELRYKESDRIASLGEEIRKLGVEFDESPDGFSVECRDGVQGGRVHSHGDHRLAMSMVVAGLAAQAPVMVEGVKVIDESYPQFIRVLQGLGAEISAEE